MSGHRHHREPGPLRRCLLVLPLGLGCVKTKADAEAPMPAAGPHDHAHHASHHAHAAGPNRQHDGHGHAHHHRFEDAEAWAKQFDDPSRDAWQRPEAVLDLIALAPDALVADLGAGTGYFAVRLARRVPRGRVIANDVEPDMVRYLGERAAKEGLDNLVPAQGKPDDPALPEAVDVAFMCNVYHHIEDRTGYFRKLAAQLRPGGRLVVVDFEKDAPDDVPGPPPQMRVAKEVLVDELAGAGFELVRVDGDVLPYQYVVELRPAKP